MSAAISQHAGVATIVMNGTGGNTDLQDAIPSPTLGQLAILFGSSTSSLYGVYIYCGNMGWHSI